MAYNADADFEEEVPVEFPKITELEQNIKDQMAETVKDIRVERKAYEERMNFEGEHGYFFQIVFRNNAERDEWLEKKRITLEHDSFVFYDDVKHLL